MMSIRAACLAAIAMFLVPGCYSDQPPAKPGATSRSSSPAKGAKDAEPAAAIEDSKDMKDFMSGPKPSGSRSLSSSTQTESRLQK